MNQIDLSTNDMPNSDSDSDSCIHLTTVQHRMPSAVNPSLEVFE